MVPDKDTFIRVTVHKRNTRFDDRKSDAEYMPLKKATQSKRGGYIYISNSNAKAKDLPIWQ